MTPADFPIVRQLAARSLPGQAVARVLLSLDAARDSSRLVRVLRDGTAAVWWSTAAAERLRMLSVAIATAGTVYVLAIGRGPAHIHTTLPVPPLVGLVILAAAVAGGADSVVRAWPASLVRAVWLRRHRRGSD